MLVSKIKLYSVILDDKWNFFAEYLNFDDIIFTHNDKMDNDVRDMREEHGQITKSYQKPLKIPTIANRAVLNRNN